MLRVYVVLTIKVDLLITVVKPRKQATVMVTITGDSKDRIDTRAGEGSRDEANTDGFCADTGGSIEKQADAASDGDEGVPLFMTCSFHYPLLSMSISFLLLVAVALVP